MHLDSRREAQHVLVPVDLDPSAPANAQASSLRANTYYNYKGLGCLQQVLVLVDLDCDAPMCASLRRRLRRTTWC